MIVTFGMNMSLCVCMCNNVLEVSWKFGSVSGNNGWVFYNGRLLCGKLKMGVRLAGADLGMGFVGYSSGPPFSK